jgi:glucans biosynthesis protein
MHPSTDRLKAAPRCGARTRSGHPCRAPAVNGKRRCRMHGGAKGSGAPFGPRNGAYRDGAHTNEMTALRKLVAKFTR